MGVKEKLYISKERETQELYGGRAWEISDERGREVSLIPKEIRGLEKEVWL